MNRRLTIFFVLITTAVVLFIGCKSTKPTTTLQFKELPSPAEAIQRIHSNHVDIKTLAARFSAETKFKDSEYFFNGSLRIVKDSAIYISATVPILSEVARVVITPDSLKFINRIESVYFVGRIEFLNELLGAEVDFFMLQALLLGNDFEHFTHEGFSVSNDKENLVLNSRARVPLSNPLAWPLENRMWVDPVNYKIKQNIFMDGPASRMIRANYKSHRKIGERVLPNSIELFFSDLANSLFVSMDLSRITLDAGVVINFSVPAAYAPLNF